MLFLLFVLFVIFTNESENKTLKNDLPDIFHTKGLLNLPYGDIEQKFDLWYDYAFTKIKLDINDGLNKVFVIKDQIYHIFYYAEDDMKPKLRCTTDSVKGSHILNQFFPFVGEFRYAGIDPFTGLEKWMLITTVLNSTNTYTLLMDKNNNPVSFTSRGVDYFSHSHPDEYVTTYHNFTKLKSIDDSVFDISAYGCDGSSTQNHKSFNLSPYLGVNSLRIEEETLKKMKTRLNNLGYRNSVLVNKHNTVWFELKAEKSDMVNSNEDDSFDWRVEGIGAHVKDQGSCGSCWSFSVVGTIEGALQIALYRRIKSQSIDLLSEQYLVDCSWTLNAGCDGGNPGDTLDWIVKNQIPLSSLYGAYEALNGKCHKTGQLLSIKKVYQIGKSKTKASKIKEIKEALKRFGPLSVAVNVVESFVYYKGGIYGSSECDGDLNHAVVLVGYGKDPITKIPYWIVRNSWSINFGVNGFIHISMEHDCGLTDEVYGVEI